MELVALGMGVGILPTFLTRGRSGLVQLTEVLHDCQIETPYDLHVISPSGGL